MNNSKLTKIVATIGPSSCSKDKLAQLMDAGVNIFRFNTKHSTPEWHDKYIRLTQQVADEKGITIGILLDLQGPELRLDTLNEEDIVVKAGEEFLIANEFTQGVKVRVASPSIYSLMQVGDPLLIADGFVETEVVEVHQDSLVVKAIHDSIIQHRKGVNLPGKDIDFPSLIERDIQQLDANARNNIDFIGLSFARSAHDIELLRSEMLSRGINAKIVAKIESQPALDRLDEIIASADAIMIARGDLGIEIPFEKLAYWQRLMIDKCRQAHKPVITATQMLESMIQNPRPTRAEVTDVAHAVLEGTDAIMLSGETAGGKYPIRAVQTMAKIAQWNEQHRAVDEIQLDFTETDPTHIVANAVASVVNSKLNPAIDKVLVFTETGYTARAIAKYRLSVPVLAITDEAKTAETLTLSYGITPIISQLPEGPFSSANDIVKQLVTDSILKTGETIVVVHGHHWQKPGNTNSLSIITL